MKISATLIIRDEASTLEPLLAQIRPHVDELVIVDTGSTDESSSIAARFADKCLTFTDCNDAEGRIADFSAARNYALEAATGDAVAWFDGDDAVRGAENLRRLASEAYTSAPGQAWAYLMPYEYERDAAGRVTTLQWRERLVYPRAGWEWRGPVHEGLLAKAGVTPTYMQTEAVVVEHQRHRSTKPRDKARNLRILEAHVRKVGETDARMLHYLGSELMLNGRIGEACYWFRRHAQLSNWSDERCLSLMHLARIAFAMGDFELAARWSVEASTTKSWPEPFWLAGQAWVCMAEAGIDPEHNLKRGVHFLQRGFELDTGGATSLLMRDPMARFDARGWLAPALAKLGRLSEAITCAELGLQGKPEHAELKANLQNWKTGRVMEAVSELERIGAVTEQARVIIGATLKGDFRVERAPVMGPANHVGQQQNIDHNMLQQSALMRPQRREVERMNKLDIVFFLGHGPEPWTPRTLEQTGMGGSETMAWEMSKRLAKLGHRVRVYAHCEQRDEKTYDGVEWFDSNTDYANDRIRCDVLIQSRRIDHLPIKATTRVLWVHDVHVGPDFMPHDAIQFDLIWCLSNWHREFFMQCYPWLPPGKVEVTRNGIDPSRFEGSPPRHPHRAIYSSSPDRGLMAAVQAWPAVRAAIPDAELHVFYGFDNWERALTACANVDHEHCGREAMNQLKLAIAKTPGIVLRGRVNQKQLAQEMLQASVWFYPTWFSETSCITAMEAQAAGLWCVCPAIAALTETVHPMARMQVDDILEALKPGPPFAGKKDRFSLDTLASDWSERLLSLVESACTNIVPKFEEPKL